jgi:hypothetical protein
MGWHDIVRPEFLEIVYRIADDRFKIRTGQVESAHDNVDFLDAGHLPCVFNSVDDAGVSTTGQNY